MHGQSHAQLLIINIKDSTYVELVVTVALYSFLWEPPATWTLQQRETSGLALYCFLWEPHVTRVTRTAVCVALNRFQWEPHVIATNSMATNETNMRQADMRQADMHQVNTCSRLQ